MPRYDDPERPPSKSPSPKAELDDDIEDFHSEDFHSVVDTEADTITRTPTPAAAMSTIKPPKPSDFTGEVRSSEAVDIFFHQLGVFLRLSKVAEEDKTDVASMFLKDRAYRWFMTKPANTIAKFADFQRELRSFFIPPDEQSVLAKRFNDAMQDRSSVADFSLELHTIADTLGDIPERILKH